jgi:hypothetical protein
VRGAGAGSLSGPGSARGGSQRLLAPLIGAALVSAGCQQGIPWRGYSFEPVYADSRAEGKLTFVYFRSWALVSCTEFEDQVLSSKAVVDATRDMNCVALEYDWDAVMAKAWGLDRPPAFAVVDPAGAVLSKGVGAVSESTLLEAVRQAKQRFHGPLAEQRPAP